jgi:hypothetical protein
MFVFPFDDFHSLFDNNPPPLDNVSDRGVGIVVDLLADWRNEPAPSASRPEVRAKLGCGPTKELALEASGAIDSYLDGSVRRITMRSLYRHLIKQAIASHPKDAPDAKVRHPAGQFQSKPHAKKAPRPRTEAELEGLRRGNEKRRLEALKRRAAREGAATGI